MFWLFIYVILISLVNIYDSIKDIEEYMDIKDKSREDFIWFVLVNVSIAFDCGITIFCVNKIL